MELEEIYVNKLKNLELGTNCRQHCEADILLCELLNKLGYEKVVDEYKKISKYYPSLGGTEVYIEQYYG